MILIDAHHHLWDPSVGEYPWMTADLEVLRRVYSLADLTPHIVGNRVRATVVVQVRADVAETVDLLALSAATPLLAGVVGWVDLTSADAGADIARLRAGAGGDRLVGLRHAAADEPDPQWLLREDVDAAMAAITEHDLTFDLEITPRELAAASKLVRRHPDLRFFVDHGAKPPIAQGFCHEWATGIAELAEAPNVWCKLSGLVTQDVWTQWSVQRLQPYVDHLLTVFGTSRLMFGSDWPVCELAASYEDVLDAARRCLHHLTPAEHDDIFCGNAQHAYSLSLTTAEEFDR
jgi:L-fuconolactonase